MRLRRSSKSGDPWNSPATAQIALTISILVTDPSACRAWQRRQARRSHTRPCPIRTSSWSSCVCSFTFSSAMELSFVCCERKTPPNTKKVNIKNNMIYRGRRRNPVRMRSSLSVYSFRSVFCVGFFAMECILA